MSASYKRAAARDVRTGDVVYLRRRWRTVEWTILGQVRDYEHGGYRDRVLLSTTNGLDFLDPGAIVRIRTSTPPHRKPIK